MLTCLLKDTPVQLVSSVREVIRVPKVHKYLSLLRQMKTSKTYLAKILWSKYSFRSFSLGSKKLLTILRSPHTDKKARDQFYLKNFKAQGVYPKFFNKYFTNIFKKLFKKHNFFWFSLEAFQRNLNESF